MRPVESVALQGRFGPLIHRHATHPQNWYQDAIVLLFYIAFRTLSVDTSLEITPCDTCNKSIRSSRHPTSRLWTLTAFGKAYNSSTGRALIGKMQSIQVLHAF